MDGVMLAVVVEPTAIDMWPLMLIAIGGPVVFFGTYELLQYLRTRRQLQRERRREIMRRLHAR